MEKLFYGDRRYKTDDNFVTLPPNTLIDAFYNPVSVLRGKKIYFVGDSLTEVNFRTDKGYVASLIEHKGISAVNKGVSVTGYSTRAEEAFIGKDSDESDAFVIFLGINDFGNVSNFKLNLETVLKSAKRLIARACIIAGDRPIGVITPMPYDRTLGDARGAGGYTLNELTNGIKQVVKEVGTLYNRSIPILDLTAINPLEVTHDKVSNESYISTYFTQKGTPDNEALHPNDLGWKIITPYISYWLEQTFMFINVKPSEKTLQVVSLPNGDLEINSITTPVKYGESEDNVFNKNKFVVTLFGNNSFTYSIRGEYPDKKDKYNLIVTLNDLFTFSTDYHPHATDYGQLFYYFDVDSITTDPDEFLANNTVKTIKEAKGVDDKEAQYILNLIRVYKQYKDNLLFTDEEKKALGYFDSNSMPMKLKIVIKKR